MSEVDFEEGCLQAEIVVEPEEVVEVDINRRKETLFGEGELKHALLDEFGVASLDNVFHKLVVYQRNELRQNLIDRRNSRKILNPVSKKPSQAETALVSDASTILCK